MPGKAVSHLSRMSLAEFNERQGEMRKEIQQSIAPADAYGLVKPMGGEVTRNAD